MDCKLRKYSLNIYCVALLIGLSITQISCVSETTYAPVVSVTGEKLPGPGSSYYRVQPGDTLYSIAWAHGVDYRWLAQRNRIPPTFEIKPGQVLALDHRKIAPAVKIRVQEKPVIRPIIRAQKRVEKMRPVDRWLWPARGNVVLGYSTNLSGNHGIDIAGRLGEMVRASAAGKVVYAGGGVRGYGNLIILKHNDNYLSAYAYNKRMLVKLGQSIKAGQPIALMGKNDDGFVRVHFEIRKEGKPVNPLKYL